MGSRRLAAIFICARGGTAKARALRLVLFSALVLVAAFLSDLPWQTPSATAQGPGSYRVSVPFISRAPGTTWTSIGPYGGSVSVIAVDPLHPTTVYAGTLDSVFVLR